MIPVQMECVPDVSPPGERPAAGVRAECTRCGKRVACAYDPTDRAPVRRVRVAKAKALSLLKGQCAERTPWGCVPAHADRGIPRGVSLYAEDHLGRHWPLAVDDRGKLVTVAGGCTPAAVVLVVPEEGFEGAAREFANLLALKRGYPKAAATGPRHKLNLPKAAEETA